MALITPDGAPDYNAKITSLLSNIRKNPVGNLVLNAVVKQVKVKPIGSHVDPKTKKTDHPQSCQGITSADDRNAANIVLKKPGEPGYDAKRDKYYSSSVRHYVYTGADAVPTGKGSGSVLYFTPGDKGKCIDHNGGNGFADPEATLLHELVHSARMSQGIVSAVPTTEHVFRHEEEFLGIEIENVYLSARDGKKAKFRHGHSSDDDEMPEWNTSKGFVDEADLYNVLKYHAQWGLFKELAKLKNIPFNPFYEFDRRAQAAKKPTANNPAPVGAGRK